MTRHLIDFSEASELARWYAINDGIMGGISKSRLDPLPDGGAAFRGDDLLLSDEYQEYFGSYPLPFEAWRFGHLPPV